MGRSKKKEKREWEIGEKRGGERKWEKVKKGELEIGEKRGGGRKWEKVDKKRNGR